MAMGPERSKPLHNFTLPCLKWGNQRHLRCMKVTSDGAAAASPSTGDRRSPGMRFENSTVTRKRELAGEMKQQFPLSGRDSEKRMRISKSRIDGCDGEDGIEAVREKIMFDLKTAADKMKDAILRKEAGEEENEVDEKEQEEPPAASAPSSAAAAAEARPWNLRTRRAACKAPIADGSGKCLKIEEKKLNHSPPRTDNANGAKLPPKSRASPDKPERPKISVPLSKKEIEEDYMGMVGHRPPRRPKKRPRNVQKALDAVFPGLWLSEITLDTYKVPEAPENGKR
ncbi:uncharacterized protein LOC114733985 [Neltuma alba]|uniref:uncharacterized protein LOC114725842 n=1 Tax=Neltuma alba TaxID=207710 RepID=UPI0010A4F6A9|nr:uncharacterized protein LOC114725842 [Prosopis alba]XP_028777293.1 uncharacterized protein LOC114733984 [Prosopis alba]XP_028777294.1 uncharacterized protein LOC114733985 [Prosopis alba]